MRVLAFTLHDVVEERQAKELQGDAFYRVTQSQFEALLSRLKRLGYQTTNSKEFTAWQRGQIQLPERTVLLTFDDGYLSHFEQVAPLLIRYRFTGTFFVSPELVGKPGYMNWNQIKKLVFLGMEVGSHGLTHRPLTQLSAPVLEKELIESKQVLEERLGLPVRSIAAPGGFWNQTVADAVAKAGYEVAWCSNIGTNGRQTLPLGLRRVVVRQPFSLERLIAMSEGWMPSFWWAAGQQRVIQLLKRVLGVYWYEQLKRRLVPNA